MDNQRSKPEFLLRKIKAKALFLLMTVCLLFSQNSGIEKVFIKTIESMRLKFYKRSVAYAS